MAVPKPPLQQPGLLETAAEEAWAIQWCQVPHGAQDLQSWLLHREAVLLLKEDPTRVGQVLQTLERWMQSVDRRSLPLLREWQLIVSTRNWRRALALTGPAQQLRQASPLGTILPQEQRLAILARMRFLKAAARAQNPV